MPVITSCSYRPPFWYPGGHAQTILPRLLHAAPAISYVRERVATDDNDFFTLDWLHAERRNCGKPKVAILSHGLEGSSRSRYMRCAAHALARRGWDVAARNYRSCGGEMSRAPKLYHSGETGDLHTAILHCLRKGYTRVALVGFSVGGNQVLKYLGEAPERAPAAVAAAAAISVPCDLHGCSMTLARRENWIYMEYFMRSLRAKVREKHKVFPELFPVAGLGAMRTFEEFDGAYTAPRNGFADARDYWTKASCAPFIRDIRIPSVIINARNDPFLTESCYPIRAAEENPMVFLMMPKEGGHVSFPDGPGSGTAWLHDAIIGFLEQSDGASLCPA